VEPYWADKEGKALKGKRWHLWQFAVTEKMLFYSSYVELCMEDPLQCGLWRHLLFGVSLHQGGHTTPVTGENRVLVTEEPVEFEKSPVGVQDFSKATHHSRGIHRTYPDLLKKNRKMSTWNWLDLETLRYQLITSNFFPNIGTHVRKHYCSFEMEFGKPR
jgi:hypothetical protein